MLLKVRTGHICCYEVSWVLQDSLLVNWVSEESFGGVVVQWYVCLKDKN